MVINNSKYLAKLMESDCGGVVVAVLAVLRQFLTPELGHQSGCNSFFSSMVVVVGENVSVYSGDQILAESE